MNRARCLFALSIALAGCKSKQSPPVIDSFSTDSAAIAPGATATLSWSVHGATRLTLDPGVGDVTGTASASVSPAADTTYTLTAVNGADPQGVQRSVSIAVVAPAAASIAAFTALPSQAAPGQPVTLSWSASNAVALTIDGQPVTGTSLIVNPSATHAYVLTATGASGPPATAKALARVASAPAIASFTATPAAISQGARAVLSWSGNAFTYSLDNGIGELGLQTHVAVEPGQTTTYTLTARGAAGTSSTRSVTVAVAPLSGTRTLSYSNPGSVAPGALLALVQDAASTPALLVLDLVTTQAVTASAVAVNLQVDGAKVALDLNQSGDTSPGFVVNTGALDPGSSPPAAKASLRTSGPLANVLTLGIAQKPGTPDASLPPGTVLCKLRFVLAAGAGGGVAFDSSSAHSAVVRAGQVQSTSVPPTEVAIGTLTVN